MVNISEKISSLRKAHNLTQEALGEAVGVSPQAVSKWEKGDSLPDISVIPDLCRVLRISADTLLGNEENMTSEMYVDKALEVCKGMDDEIRLLHKILRSGVPKDTAGDNYIATNKSNAHYFSLDDCKGFGMFIHNMEYVKQMMDIDFSKNMLLKFISDEKALKIFLLICINGSMNENEIVKMTGFTEQEVKERIYSLMTNSFIGTSITGLSHNDGATIMVSQLGILLLGVISCVFLSTNESRAGKGICERFNIIPDMQRRFVD